MRCCHLKGMRVSLGRLPSSRRFGSVLKQAVADGGLGQRETLTLRLHVPTVWPPGVDVTLFGGFDVVQGFGQLRLKDGGNGEPRKWSDPILIHLCLQERLNEEVFQPAAWLGEVDRAEREFSEGLCLPSPSTL